MNVSVEEARDMTDYEPGQKCNGFTIIENRRIGQRRWVSEHELIVRGPSGTFWCAVYEQGLTENQETQPFDGVDYVTFHEVIQIPTTTYVYEKAK